MESVLDRESVKRLKRRSKRYTDWGLFLHVAVAAVFCVRTQWIVPQTGTSLATTAQNSQTRIELSLHDAVQLALKQNPEEMVARIRVEERRRELQSARGALLPQAEISSSVSVIRFNQQSIIGGHTPEQIGPFQVVNAGGIFSQNVLDLPAVRRYQASKENVVTAIAEHALTREEIVSAVVASYLSSLKAKATLDAAHVQRQLAQRLYDQAQELTKNGIGTNLDSVRANVELQNQIQREIDAGALVKTTLYALAELLSLPSEQDVEVTDAMQGDAPANDDIDSLVKEALHQRPELLSLDSAQRAAHLESKATSEQRLPSVQFFGSYHEQGRLLSNPIPSYSYTGLLSIPLWTSGRLSAEMAHARLEEHRIAEQRQDTANLVLQQVRTAVERLRAARSAVVVANYALTLAQQEVAQAERRFQAGVSTNIDVITAQNALARASDNQIDALYRFNQSRADLARATGDAENVFGH